MIIAYVFDFDCSLYVQFLDLFCLASSFRARTPIFIPMVVYIYIVCAIRVILYMSNSFLVFMCVVRTHKNAIEHVQSPFLNGESIVKLFIFYWFVSIKCRLLNAIDCEWAEHQREKEAGNIKRSACLFNKNQTKKIHNIQF